MSNLAGSAAAPPHVVVTIATYKRPDSLAALLLSLQNQRSDFLHKIVIVDNDAAGSAQGVSANFAPDAVYVVEPRPGISAARNAGVKEALRLKPRTIAFIDDDETAPDSWLQELVNCMDQFDADVVTGPVKYQLPGIPADYKYFETLERVNGSDVKYVATNNALVRAHWFDGDTQLKFDDRFGLSGGEDLELFLRLQQQGGKCVWAKKAMVMSEVQPDRLEWIWHIRRELRNGQLIARLRHEFDGYSRIRLAIEGLRKVSSGIIRAVPEAMHGNISMPVQFDIIAGVGWIRAGVGLYYLEYAPDRAAPSTKSSGAQTTSELERSR